MGHREDPISPGRRFHGAQESAAPGPCKRGGLSGLKRFCFDNSGFTNPHVRMPETVGIYRRLWQQMTELVVQGDIATTQEIYDEMCHVPNDFGTCICENRASLVME